MSTRRYPPLGRSLRVDGIAFAANRGEHFRFRTRRQEWWNVARLCMHSGDFQAMALYRLRSTLRQARVPVLPALIGELCAWMFKARIGDSVVIAPGVYVPHGSVSIDGETTIGSGCVITPWVRIGPCAREIEGPTIESGVFIGAHATIRGPVSIGRKAQIGAGAQVVSDVPAFAIVAGVPAKVIGHSTADGF